MLTLQGVLQGFPTPRASTILMDQEGQALSSCASIDQIIRGKRYKINKALCRLHVQVQ